jgi:hypothetical protein
MCEEAHLALGEVSPGHAPLTRERADGCMSARMNGAVRE